jgi:hypothetical protein
MLGKFSSKGRELIDFRRLDQIPKVFREMLKPLAAMKGCDLGSHRNSFVGYPEGGEVRAVGIFTTMLDHEVVVPLSFAYAPGADVNGVTPALIQGGFDLEKGYCGGAQKFVALCVQDRVLWDAIARVTNHRLFPDLDREEPKEVTRLRRQLPRIYGLPSRMPDDSDVVIPVREDFASEEAFRASWWAAQSAKGYFLGMGEVS